MRTRFVLVAFVALVSGLGCSSESSKSRFPETQSSATEKVVLLGVQRGSTWESAQANPQHRGFDIPAEHELLVIRYSIEEIPGASMPTPVALSLDDAAGNALPISSEVIFSVPSGGGTATTERAFIISQGAQAGTLRINATQFSLRDLPVAPARHGTW